jgi:uncharacterized protein (DUF1778 family)
MAHMTGKEIKVRLQPAALAEVSEAAQRVGLRRSEFMRAASIRAARREIARGVEVAGPPEPRAA